MVILLVQQRSPTSETLLDTNIVYHGRQINPVKVPFVERRQGADFQTSTEYLGVKLGQMNVDMEEFDSRGKLDQLDLQVEEQASHDIGRFKLMLRAGF